MTLTTDARIVAVLARVPQDPETQLAALGAIEDYRRRALDLVKLYGPESPNASAAHVELARRELLGQLRRLRTKGGVA